jgi:hypothetical protein
MSLGEEKETLPYWTRCKMYSGVRQCCFLAQYNFNGLTGQSNDAQYVYRATVYSEIYPHNLYPTSKGLSVEIFIIPPALS